MSILETKKPTRVLIICDKARMRSPTAADIYAQQGHVETDFSGLSNDADEKLSSEQIEWADVIYVMEQRQKKRLTSLFGSLLKNKRIICLNVPDKYDYMQPELAAVLREKLSGLK